MNALAYHIRTHGMLYVDYVIKHEYNGIWPTCKCGKRLVLKKGGFGRFCGKGCASSGSDNAMTRMKGEKSPNFGKKRTPEQLVNYSEGSRKRWMHHGDKLREMMKTPEYKNAQAISQRQVWATTNRREKTSMSVHRFWSSGSELTKQRRKEASDRAIILLEQNKIGPQAPFKTCYITNPFTGKEEYMHSSWETAFLMKCYKEQYPVTKIHDIRIPYVAIDGTDHVYVPDFVSLVESVVFEIKGLVRENDEAKFSALQKWASVNGYEVVMVSIAP